VSQVSYVELHDSILRAVRLVREADGRGAQRFRHISFGFKAEGERNENESTISQGSRRPKRGPEEPCPLYRLSSRGVLDEGSRAPSPRTPSSGSKPAESGIPRCRSG